MTLHLRSLYRHPDIDYLVNKEIVEYDMRRAGISLIKKYKLLPESQIAQLELLEKKEQEIAIGKLQRDSKEFTRSFNQAFKDGRLLFFEANGLNEDNVLSIKRDAIFTLKECYDLEFEGLTFVDKNRYTSYYLFDKYEYYLFDEGIDVKGISDEKLEKHIEYMLGTLYTFMKLMENGGKKVTIEFIRDFTQLYKTKSLATEFYRELNDYSLYRLFVKLQGKQMGSDYVEGKDIVDIRYNFASYILPMINIALDKR